MQEAPVQVGDVLADKFRVERILGVGGMGVVVAATHLHLDQMVAIKFMLGAHSSGSDIAGRFLREAKAAARLKSQHIVKVLDVGTMHDGAPYMVMEFLEGADLEQVVKQRQAAGHGPLPPAVAVDYITQACLGMAEAHSQGFVHRDLKPPNLFLCRGEDDMPLVKILDFGIAKAAFDGIQTSTQAIMGSPFYMSPEQWQGARHVDERGDIWALGAILHYLLSGTEPFAGTSLPELFASIASQAPRSLGSDLPDGLQDVVRRCLEKSPASRPQNVAQLAALLAPFGPAQAAERARKAARIASSGERRLKTEESGDGTAAPGNVPVVATTMRASAGPFAVPPSDERRTRSKWLLPALAIAAFATLTLVFVFVLAGGTESSAGRAAPEELVGAQGSAPPDQDDLSETMLPIDEDEADAGNSIDQEGEVEDDGELKEEDDDEESTATSPPQVASTSRDAPDRTKGRADRRARGTSKATADPKSAAIPKSTESPSATPKAPTASALPVAEQHLTGPSGEIAAAALPPLSRDQVKSAMKKVRPGVIACGKEHAFSGKIETAITIAPSGTTSARLSSGTTAFRECAEKAIGQAQLPPSTKGVKVTYSFVLPTIGPARTLASADVAKGMDFVRPGLNLCRRNYGDDELVVIHLTISAGGAVLSARVDDSRAGYKRCLEDTSSRARFPVTLEGFNGRFRYRP